MSEQQKEVLELLNALHIIRNGLEYIDLAGDRDIAKARITALIELIDHVTKREST